MTQPFALGPGEGETIEGPAGGPLTFKARSEQTGGSLTAFENVIAPGDGPPLHTHADEDEAWYVLAGRLRFRLGETLSEAPAGSFVFVPRGTPHCFHERRQGPGTDPRAVHALRDGARSSTDSPRWMRSTPPPSPRSAPGSG